MGEYYETIKNDDVEKYSRTWICYNMLLDEQASRKTVRTLCSHIYIIISCVCVYMCVSV